MRLPIGIVGVREPLHIDSSPRGDVLERSFIQGLEVLAKQDLLFESCNRVDELEDLYNSIKQVPEAKIVGKLIDIKKKDAISVNTETLPVKIFSNIIMHTLIRE